MMNLVDSGLPPEFITDLQRLEFNTTLDLVKLMRWEPDLARKMFAEYGLNFDVLLVILKASLTAQELAETFPPERTDNKSRRRLT